MDAKRPSLAPLTSIASSKCRNGIHILPEPVYHILFEGIQNTRIHQPIHRLNFHQHTIANGETNEKCVGTL